MAKNGRLYKRPLKVISKRVAVNDMNQFLPTQLAWISINIYVNRVGGTFMGDLKVDFVAANNEAK